MNNERKPTPRNISFGIGKIPPSACDLEEAVIGACLIEKEAIYDVIDFITEESFYKEEHKKIFAAIIKLFQCGKSADILSITEHLKKTGDLDFVGGPYYISQLTSRISSSAGAQYHAAIIQQKFIARELIRISLEIIRDSYDDTSDVFDLIETAEKNILSVSSFTGNKTASDINIISAERIKYIESINNRKGELTGIPSGFTEIDRITNGWQKPDLIILAARPSMGKTAMALSLAINAARFNHAVAFFSLEMSKEQLTDRRLSIEVDIPLYKLQKGGLETHHFGQLNSVRDINVFVDDTASLSLMDFRRKARKLKAEKKIELIVIDYLQLMTVSGKNSQRNREQEVSEISRGLKAVAKELNIPIIALSQLSRELEKRGNKKPILSDLRESGAIEQDADIVAFLHRPEYYDKENPEFKGWGLFMIEKHRNGALGMIKLRWTDYLTKFSDWSEINYGQAIHFGESKNEPF